MLKIDDLTTGQRPLNESDAWSSTPTYDPSHRTIMVDDPVTGRRPAITPEDLWDYPGAENRMVDDTTGRHPIGLAPEHRLRVLVKSLGGSLYLPNVSNFENSDGTTVATENDPVGYVDDLAGDDNAIQATTANKPLLKQTDGKSNWLFDNSNDYLKTPINPTSSGYMCVSARQDEALGGVNTLFGAGKAIATIQAGIAIRVSATGYIQIQRITTDGTNDTVNTTVPIAVGEPFTASGSWTNTDAYTEINGAGVGASTVDIDAHNASTVLIIGARNEGTSVTPVPNLAFGGAIFGAVHIPSVPSAADQATIRKLMGQIAGVSGVV